MKFLAVGVAMVLLSLSCAADRPATQPIADSSAIQPVQGEQTVASNYIPECPHSYHSK